jgi:hypothetical protein
MEFEGLVDLRAALGDSDRSWVDEGLDKQRFDDGDSGLQLGQAAVEVRAQPFDTVTAVLVANAYTDRHNLVDITEAYALWKPLPKGAWRWTARGGAFFPPISLENGGTGWTSQYMLSSSAINTWVGEELRTVGGELTLARPGRFVGSKHDINVGAGLYRNNDAAGGLLTWRGWSIGDRVTGLTERVRLPDLPVFRDGNYFGSQAQWEEPFHEIDDRTGFYDFAEYGWDNRLRLRALHYNNRGDPWGFTGGQWSWETEFDALGASWQQGRWTLLAQYMKGATEFGEEYYGVYGDFRAAYVLLSLSAGRHRFSLRYDDFRIDDEDDVAPDPNGEDGRGAAAAWLFQLDDRFDLGAEYLWIDSDRPARGQIGVHDSAVDENLFQLALRWHW